MKDKIAELLIEIGLDSKDAERAAERLEKKVKKTGQAAKSSGSDFSKLKDDLLDFEKTSARAERVASALTKVMAAVGATVLGLGKMVLETGATFESMRASLKTVTGSARGADEALSFIRSFTSKTPFQLEEVTNAFVKLKALGLDPSERALTAYGDTASAMGKSLDQMIEAVADATTGEFERLKEFGIKASSQGDKVVFTFRGVKTEVRKNSKDIEDFLINLGESNFGGAMGEQMLTLNGLISNLKDAFAEFLLSIAEGGVLEEFKALIDDIKRAAGDKDGLAKTLSQTLVSAIKQLRRFISGDMVESLETAVKVLQFLVENWEIFVGLIAGAKTLQAFSSAAAGLRALGVAANASLGPIGLIMSALVALIPVANKAGNALGDALGHTPTGGRKVTKEDLSKPAIVSEAGLGGVAERQSNKLMAAEQKLLEAQQAGDSKARIRVLMKNVSDAQLELERTQEKAQKIVDEKRAAEEVERKRVEAEAALDAAEMQEFGDFDAQVAEITNALAEKSGRQVTEIDPETGETVTFTELDQRGQEQLDKAIVELAVSGDVKKARKAAGLDKKKGRGGKKKKDEEKKVTSPTTVSEFFGAAARGELGPIAAKTPSTKDIEPTVAVDITNNNFTFKIEQKITGVSDPVKAGEASAAAVKKEFEVRLARAGQSLDTTLKR